MKIRKGFVSNSSSSSFLIYGIAIDEGEEEKLVNVGEDGDIYEAFYEVLEDVKLEIHTPENYGTFIGMSWDEVKDDETGKQFKERVEKKLKKVFDGKLKGFKLGTHSMAWRDG